MANRIEVCRYDPAEPKREIDRFDLIAHSAFVFHACVPGFLPGTRYGLRVHGRMP